jgi:CDGSH-type Zn-finger protein
MSESKPVLVEHRAVCGCGRSPTGYCNGNHRYSNEEWDRMLLDDQDAPTESVVSGSTVISE